MSDEQQHPLVDVRDPAAPAPEAPTTAPGQFVPVPVPADVKSRRRAGNSKGGHAPRAVALIGLGANLGDISLRTSDDQLRLLEAVASAVAQGKTSGLVASALTTIVKTANTILQTDQAEAIARLEERVAQLIDARTISR